MDYDSVIPCLLERIPEFRLDYEDLLEAFGDKDGVGVHVVMGRLFQVVLRETRNALHAPDSSSAPLVNRALRFIEELAACENLKVQELVQSSFFEHMWQASEVEKAFMTGLLGPHSTGLWQATE